MGRPSDEKLAAALSDAGLTDMAERAERGEWNDYFSELPSPKLALVAELARRECDEDLRRRVAAGEFDSGKEESEEWYRSPEGQAMRGLLSS